MDPAVWHTQVAPAEADVERGPELQCSICFTTYDNVFKTPKQLDCTHTFCLECLSRLLLISMEPQETKISCPFCRRLTPVPKNGPPALTTSQEVLCRLPSHLRREEAVWLEGEKLCYKRPLETGTPAFCICVDIGASGQAGAAVPVQTRTRPGLLERLTDWKKLVLFVVVMVLLVVIVLWPLQCIVTTGSMRCMPRPRPATSTVATFTLMQP
ncbi:RING finger protein 223 [Brachyhypopomus gauderio]|uniref:RING finger protein 223 n=1 Tax=Brachyhypopomus gauderio TaxID=698409 RepID=UPI0040422DC8